MRIFNEDDKTTTVEFVMEMGARGIGNAPGPPGPPGEDVDPQDILLSQASDMDMTGAVIGNFVRYNGTGFYIGYMILDDALDVVLTTPQAGNTLIFDGVNWTNGMPSGGPGTGTVIWDGAGPPSGATGTEDSYYLDTTNHVLYGPKSGTSWPIAIATVPAGGLAGEVLTKSTNSDYAVSWNPLPDPPPPGSLIRIGWGEPDQNTGVYGDYYVDRETQELWGPKERIFLGQRSYTGVIMAQPGQWSTPQDFDNFHIAHQGLDGLDYQNVLERYIKPGNYIEISVPGKATFIGHIDGVNQDSLGGTPIFFSTDSQPLDGFWTTGDIGDIYVRSPKNQAAFWDIVSPGTLILNGTVPPVDHIGMVGNYYHDLEGGLIYGPKRSKEEFPPIWPVATQNPSVPPPNPADIAGYAQKAFRSTILAVPGGNVWTTFVSSTASNMPAGKYFCHGTLFGYSNVAVGGSIRVSTPEGESQWSPVYSAGDSIARVLSSVTHIYSKPSAGPLTINCSVAPTVAGLTVAIGSSIAWHYVGK